MRHIRKCDAFSVTHKRIRVIDFSTHVCRINHMIWRKTSFIDQKSERDNPFLKIRENLRILRISVHGENQKLLRVFRSGFGIKSMIYFLLLFTFYWFTYISIYLRWKKKRPTCLDLLGSYLPVTETFFETQLLSN